ncbi:MAG: tryptophan-rich sensory protein [Planctomycetota bacterium]|nr:tryptophan-rich sensory protein [Planctomycetota bacterium]
MEAFAADMRKSPGLHGRAVTKLLGYVMVLLTGATGYVGSHLLSTLLHRGHAVRCFARHVDRLPEGVREVSVQGEIDDPGALARALEGVETAYYLIHAMTHAQDFASTDREYARLFGEAARQAGVKRIIYLGGLGHGKTLSKHLASRQEVGDTLRASGVPVVEFRASVIVGAGSISFELARALVDKLPIMVTPRWVRTPAQPIAIQDVIAYLVEAAEIDLPNGGLFEIGGADRVSYGGLMHEYARQRGRWHGMVPVPVLTPRVSSLWLALVVPRYARVGKLLIDGVRNETTVVDDSALRVFSVKPMGIEEATRRAIAEIPPESAALTGTRAWLALAVCIGACLGAGALGSLVSMDGIATWYPSIAKPAWTPPAWVFGPVWSILYLLMGMAAWRVWRRDGLREGALALGVFGLQLACNAIWSGLFFGLRRPGFALLDLLVLWMLILITIVLFAARDRMAAWLLVPYLGWVSFAGVLNAAIVQMNP